MSIPTFDRLMRPVLELATREPISRKKATEAMIHEYGLTAEEIAQKLPSGDLTINNRTGWAMTF